MNMENTTKAEKGKIGIIGLGFVGLPLAIVMADKGFNVVGIDLDERKIKAINDGKSYIQDITDDQIVHAANAGKLAATTDYSAVSSVDSIIVCVPTPLTAGHEPDLKYLISVSKQLTSFVRPGQLIVIESSTYPGTTKEIVQPILEQSGLVIGQQLYLAYSPERIDPGNKKLGVEQIPKVVSGVTANCLEEVRKLYEQVFDRVVVVSSTEAAEMTKILENTFRLINISFINEIAKLCDRLSIDVWEVISAASTKPYGFSAFYPGPGIGGHCIPVDPLYLQWKALQIGAFSQFIELALTVNQSMPSYIIEQISQHLPAGKKLTDSRILVYGVTYKKDIADVRESMALPLIQLLKQQGATVAFHDPYVASIRLEDGTELSSSTLTEDELAGADCVLILTDHSVMPAQLISDHSVLIYDTRNVIHNVNKGTKLVKLGGRHM